MPAPAGPFLSPLALSRDSLCYCANVHPGSDLAAVEANVAGPIAEVRRLRGLDRMACGLWLAAPVARTLARAPGRLKDLLEDNGLTLMTLNGFPYGDFHGERVKEAVYAPGWDDPERLIYSLDLAQVLTHCMDPSRPEGTISSLPLGLARDWTRARHRRALDNLCAMAGALAEVKAETGRHLRLCLEPEPGCTLESTDQAIALFTLDLPEAATRSGLDPAPIREHLGICLDVCHQAVLFEDPAQSMTRLRQAGIVVGKVQVSSALTVPTPDRVDLAALLAPFAEPRYLHQVRTRAAGGALTGWEDLPQALAAKDRPGASPWRIHYHIPIQHGDLGLGLGTTQAAIGAILDWLAREPGPQPHLEVETYTWDVLPPPRHPDGPHALAAGLAAELTWLEGQMELRGLLDRSPGGGSGPSSPGFAGGTDP